jgi:DNA repair exonuclease SbcCD nuclease subunit
MAKILHTADVHLKKFNDERWQALSTVLKLANQLSVDVLTIAGDLFDQNVASNELRDEKLRKLFSKQKFKIIILPGNHDASSFGHGFYFGDNVTVIEKSNQLIKLKDTTIAGIPFEPLSASELFKTIESINSKLNQDSANILLFHGELTDLFFNSSDFGDEGQKRYMPLKLNLLEHTNFDYILAGHFHSKYHVKRLPNKRQKQGGYFVYPGSPVSITTKEIGPRSATLINTQKSPKQVELETLYYENVEIFISPEDDQKILKQIEGRLKKLPANAIGLLKINGFINHKKLTLTETGLKKELIKLAEKYSSQISDEDFAIKDIGAIINSGLYRVFVDELEKTKFDQAYKQQLVQNFVNALMQVNS